MNEQLISLEEIEARANAATRGDWAVYEHPYQLDGGATRVEYRIGTAYDHPQLHGPSPVVSLMFSLLSDGKAQTKVSVSREDAEFIAHARRDVPLLLELVRTLMARDKEPFVAPNEGLEGEDLNRFAEIVGQSYSPLTGRGKYELSRVETVQEAMEQAETQCPLASDVIAVAVWWDDIRAQRERNQVAHIEHLKRVLDATRVDLAKERSDAK